MGINHRGIVLIILLLTLACKSTPVNTPNNVSQNDPNTPSNTPTNPGDTTSNETLPEDYYLPISYPETLTYSPITKYVTDNLKSIKALSNNNTNVFMKVGDSITVNTQYMGCFAGNPSDIVLDGNLWMNTVYSFFNVNLGGGTNPFNRVSNAAKVGIDAEWATTVDGGLGAVPITYEINALHPLYALTMYGTNSVARGGSDDRTLDNLKFTTFFRYYYAMLKLMINSGVIPIVMTIPHHMIETRNPYITRVFNRMVRAMAEYFQIPFIDYYKELDPINRPDLTPPTIHGIPDPTDDVHPIAYNNDYPCNFTSQGLLYGINLRNYLSMRMLDNMKKIFNDGQDYIDESSSSIVKQQIQGSGSISSPYIVSGLPFIDIRNIKDSTNSTLSDYSGCSKAYVYVDLRPQAKPGPEYVYKLVLTQSKGLRIYMMTPDAEVDGSGKDNTNMKRQLFVLKDTADGSGCIAYKYASASNTFSAGTYYIIVDTATIQGAPQDGNYMLMISECESGDDGCDTHELIHVEDGAGDPAYNW